MSLSLQASLPTPRPNPCRCSCGALIARLIGGGVEIRCRRCKRTHVIPLDASPGA